MFPPNPFNATFKDDFSSRSFAFCEFLLILCGWHSFTMGSLNCALMCCEFIPFSCLVGQSFKQLCFITLSFVQRILSGSLLACRCQRKLDAVIPVQCPNYGQEQLLPSCSCPESGHHAILLENSCSQEWCSPMTNF